MISAIVGMIVLLLIEAIGNIFDGNISPLTPEFIALFPSQTIALEVDILLYGVFGLVFSAMSFIYEQERIGFVVQNLIYALGTAIVWIPIVIFMWQLQKYPQALVCTIVGFFATYMIMTIVAYRDTKKNVEEVNRLLEAR